MAKRRPRFESLEPRLCLSLPTLQTTFSLPSTGFWTPSVYRASPLFFDIFGTGKDDLIAVATGPEIVAYQENADGTASPIVTYQTPNSVADIKGTPIIVKDPSTGKYDLFAGDGSQRRQPQRRARHRGWPRLRLGPPDRSPPARLRQRDQHRHTTQRRDRGLWRPDLGRPPGQRHARPRRHLVQPYGHRDHPPGDRPLAVGQQRLDHLGRRRRRHRPGRQAGSGRRRR